MAEIIFIGGATAVAQVNSETPANVEVGDIFTVTLSNSGGDRDTISYTAAAATAKDCVEGLNALAVAAAAAGTVPWNEVTCTENDAIMTVTADTAGVPFWVTTTATNGGAADTQTLTDASVTAVAGPGILSTAENYRGDAIPVNGDTLTFDPAITADIYGYDMSGVTLGGLNVKPGVDVAMGGKGEGLHFTLKVSSTYYNADLSGTGASYFHIDDYHAINVHKAGPSTNSRPWALNLVGDHDADSTGGRGTINIRAGSNESVSIAANPGEDMEVNKIIVSGEATVEVGYLVRQFDSSEPPDMEILAGTVTTHCPTENVTISGGDLYHEESNLTTLLVEGGVVHYKAAVTLTTLHVYTGGEITFADDLRARTVTNATRHGTGKFWDPHKTATLTNGLKLSRCGIDANLNLGKHITITPSAF